MSHAAFNAVVYISALTTICAATELHMGVFCVCMLTLEHV